MRLIFANVMDPVRIAVVIGDYDDDFDPEPAANCEFIVAAVNACFALSPQHPERVPGLVPDLVAIAAHIRDKLLDEQAAVTGIDAGVLNDVLLALGVDIRKPTNLPPRLNMVKAEDAILARIDAKEEKG